MSYHMAVTKEDINAMTTQEKKQLLEMIWESFDESQEKTFYIDDLPEDSEEEIQILKERLEEYKKDPSSGKSWDEAYTELKRKYE